MSSLDQDTLLRVEDLTVVLPVGLRGEVCAVNGVGLEIGYGQRVGLVGESGSGKSVTGRTIAGLLPQSRRVRVSGQIRIAGNIMGTPGDSAWEKVREKTVGMIFQDPLSYLNPTMQIGRQVGEAIRTQGEGGRNRQVEHYLEMAGLDEPASLLRRYPFELSGGMRQRVLIAIALAKEPDLIIADEPTTALDVTVQARVLRSLEHSVSVLGASLLMISHDLAVVARMCDWVNVMCQGRIVESGPTIQVFSEPQHEYTAKLLKNVRRLSAIPS